MGAASRRILVVGSSRFGRLAPLGLLGPAICAACATRPALEPPAPAAERIAIVASERGPQGARLVAIDERGDRQFELIVPATTAARDLHPALSPDGRWIVFASTRERDGAETSLWIARLGVEAVPVRLTSERAIDTHPVWTRDGAAIVFASTRAGGDFDLWRQPIARGRAAGRPTQLTSGPDHEVTPTIAPDGTIVYAAVRATISSAAVRVIGVRGVESRLEARGPDGTIHPLTPGPADSAPALSPDGVTLVFARPRTDAGDASGEADADVELWRMPRGADPASAQAIVKLPLTEERDPVWSRDGRFIFATSLWRGATGQPLFSSVVFVDLTETPARARMLKDRAGAIARLTPAIATPVLDVAALRADPEYLPELANIMAAAIAEQRMQR